MENKKAPTRLREIPQKRDLYSKHFLNDDGSFTAEISLGLIHYKDENEQFQDLSVELFDEDLFDQVDFPVTKEKKASYKAKREILDGLKNKTGASRISREDSSFHGLKVPFDMTISKQFKKGYSIGKGSSRLTFKPEGANATKGEKISYNEIKYSGAWNQTDVILELKPRGIKETIILYDETAPNIFSFEVTGPLEDDLTADGLQVEKAWLMDAVGEKRDVQTKVRRQGARIFLDLIADVYGLKYPIEIDPTTNIQPDSTAGKDAYGVSSLYNTNYGSIDTFRIGKPTGGENYQTYIQFDLSGIPSGAQTKSAILSLYVVEREQNEIHTRISPFSAAWSESTITYNNKPATSAPLDPNVIFTNFKSSGTWHDIDVTNTVNAWTSGQMTNNGMMLDDASANIGNIRTSSSSDYYDSGFFPKISINYNVIPGAPVVTAPNGGETWDKTHTITWQAASDTEIVETAPSEIGNISGLGDYSPFGQTYKVSRSGTLKSVSVYFNTAGTYIYPTVTVKDVVNGKGGSVTYASKQLTVIVPSGQFNKTTFTFDTPIQVTAGQMLAFEFSGVPNGTSMYITANGVNSYSDGSAYFSSGVQARDFRIEVEEISSSLQYQIQVSTNNGTSWSDLVALTAAGVTSTNFDFSSVAESTQAKIRIRAYDGSAYGPWDESNAVFTIKHNTAPTAPTNLSPGSTSSTTPEIVTTLTPSVGWTFNDTVGDAQSAFQVLVYDTSGVLKHDSGKVVSANKTYTIPAGAGLVYKTKYYWRVRTYDSKDAFSPYSVDEWIMPNQAPTGTVTAPAATSGVGTVYNDTLTPGISWSYSDPNGDPQASVQIQVKDGSTTVFDSGEIATTGTSYTIPGSAGLVYDKTYNVVIRAKDNQGTWGAYSAAKYFHLNRSPGAPTGLSPGSTNAASPVILNNNLVPRLSWTFSDPDPTDAQSKFQIWIYDASGPLVHTSGLLTSANNYYDVPAGILLAGKKYYWTAYTQDSHYQGGAVSASAYIYTNESPDVPINASPGGGSAAAPAQVMNTLTPRLSWTFKDEAGEAQTNYQLRLYNEAGTILIDTGQVSSANGYYDIPALNKLAYNSKYQWEVRTMDPYGQWSNYTSRLWIQPKMAAPTGLTATADNFGAKIILDWNDSGGEELQGYNVYRATSSGGTYTKLNGALLTASLYNDTQVSTGQTYYYKVEAVASGETSPLSSEASATAIFANWYIGNFKFLGPSSMKGKRPRAQSKRTVLGKSKKVIQDRGFLGQELQLEIYLVTDEYSSGKSKFDQLMTELEVTAEISVRDPFGQVWKVAPGDVDFDVIPGTGSLAYKVSFPLEEVN